MAPRALLLLASLGAALSLWWPAFRSLPSTGFGDWQYFHHMWEAGYAAIVRHGEWPLWDPYHCGGITLIGNPQSQVWSPLFFVALVLGPTLALKLFVVAHAWAGFAGMVVFARREIGLGAAPAWLASAAWAGSGFFAWHGGGGHAAFMPFYLTPWLLLAWRAAARERRYTVAVAALLTLVLLEGGVYPFPCLVVLLLFDAVARLHDREQRVGIVVAGLLAGVLTAVLGALRLVPILDELSRHPRTMDSTDGLSLAELLEMLTAREHAWRVPGHPFVWPEYGTFVGWTVVVLGALGVLCALRARRLSLVAGLFLFGALTLGEHEPLSAWGLLHRLPVYDSLRVPSRFAVFFTFYLALCAGLGLQWLGSLALRARLSPRALRVVELAPWLVVLGAALDLLAVNVKTVDRWRGAPIAREFLAPRYYLRAGRDYGRVYASLPRMNLGTAGCYEAMSFEVARGLWAGDQPQARIVRGSGEVSEWGRSTSRAFAVVTLADDADVVFNQNYARGWQSSVGSVEADAQGRLVVRGVPAGRQRIELRYRPPTLGWGLGLSLLGIVLCALVLRFAAREPRRRAP